jgi:hypothetical protein
LNGKKKKSQQNWIGSNYNVWSYYRFTSSLDNYAMKNLVLILLFVLVLGCDCNCDKYKQEAIQMIDSIKKIQIHGNMIIDSVGCNVTARFDLITGMPYLIIEE